MILESNPAPVTFARDDDAPPEPFQRIHDLMVGMHGGRYCKGKGHAPGASTNDKQWQMLHDMTTGEQAQCAGHYEDYQPPPTL